MFTAIILILLVAAIVVASRRWQELETKLFGHTKPPSRRVETAPQAAKTVSPEVSAALPKAADKPAEPIAGGVMHRRELSTEPDVDPGVMQPGVASAPEVSTEPVESEVREEAFSTAEPVAKPAETSAAQKTEPEEEVGPPPLEVDAPKQDAKDTPEPAVSTKPTSQPVPEPTLDTPGRHVTGDPAVPSEPAYVDATHGLSDDFDELSRIADQAYRDREYEKAEQACLKILMQQPKNHKYMTRIGQIYQEMGNLEDAKEAFEAAKTLDPKNFFVLNRLTEVERQLADKGGKKVTKKK
jgi:hypothetical protein